MAKNSLTTTGPLPHELEALLVDLLVEKKQACIIGGEFYCFSEEQREKLNGKEKEERGKHTRL